MDLLCPSYLPSIPQVYCELCKNVYYITPNIPYIATSLKLECNNEGLKICIDIAGKLTMTLPQWNSIIMENAKIISDFFINNIGSFPPQTPATTTTTNQHISFVCTPEYENASSYIVIHLEDQPMMCITGEEWFNLEHFLEYINMRINNLEKVKTQYENRINFFIKRLKTCCPHGDDDNQDDVKTFAKFYQIINNLYDKTSLIDQEIKCYLSQYLFYSALLY